MLTNYTVMFRERDCYTALVRIDDTDIESALQSAKDQFGYANNGQTSFCIWRTNP